MDTLDTVEIHPKILYYGTPVALLCTQNEDRTFNLAPMSSSWALGYTILLGIGASGQTAANLLERPELTINFPNPELFEAVERLAPLTGRDPVPEEKRTQFRTERRKFEAAGLTPIGAIDVQPPRVAECPLQFEARVVTMRMLAGEQAYAVEARVLRVHAHPRIVEPPSHIDVSRWHPLLYLYRHYFGRGVHLGATFRAESGSRHP
ncbi:MAG TPA: flavin reductase family protein [Verrucomicrobiae bacterium]|nr:flavin reductase family protein [Verrucomicrobiae bacterium]